MVYSSVRHFNNSKRRWQPSSNRWARRLSTGQPSPNYAIKLCEMRSGSHLCQYKTASVDKSKKRVAEVAHRCQPVSSVRPRYPRPLYLLQIALWQNTKIIQSFPIAARSIMALDWKQGRFSTPTTGRKNKGRRIASLKGFAFILIQVHKDDLGARDAVFGMPI